MSFVDNWILDSTSSTNALNSNTGGEGGDKKTPDFLTQQSIASFPFAAAVVTAFWKLVKDALFEGDKWASSAWVPLAIAAVIILAGVAYTWSDLTDAGKKLSAVILGAMNAGLLTMAVVGIEVQVFSG